MIIGTYCIEMGAELLTADRDFLPMRDHLGLRLVDVSVSRSVRRAGCSPRPAAVASIGQLARVDRRVVAALPDVPAKGS